MLLFYFVFPLDFRGVEANCLDDDAGGGQILKVRCRPQGTVEMQRSERPAGRSKSDGRLGSKDED